MSMASRAIQVLLIAAVVVALGWVVIDPGHESLFTSITAVVALLTLRRSGSAPRPRLDPSDLGRRVAVLPLENITEGEGKQYFADGLTEELISVLSRVTGLRIIARSSVERYRDQNRPVAEIGRELDVGAILEGSVRSTETELRISVRLIEARSESHLWSADYDRELRDVFSVQRDIAHEVAKALEVSVLGSEASRIEKPPTTDLEAYDLYLLGRHSLNKRTDEGLHRSIELFRSAVEKDPGFGGAYAGLADAYVLATIGYANIPFPEAAREARDASARALEIDDALADAHTSRGWVLLNLDWDFPGAEAEFRRAIEVNPSDARAFQWLAQCYLYQNLCEEGIAPGQQAQELDPRSPLIAAERGWPFFYTGRNSEALRHFNRAIDLEPGFPLGHFNVGNVLESEGRIEEALANYEHAASLSGNAPMYQAFRARALALLGKRAEALGILNGVIGAAETGASSSVYVAHVYDGLGEVEEASRWLERARERRDPIVLAIHSTWLPFQSLRGTARYDAILDSLPVDKRS
jgi:TolB-like protein/predicted Zn-dependent protease